MRELPTSTPEQERSGAAAALLSLDVVRPFYSHLGVPAPEPSTFIQTLRDSILDNRQAFLRDPSRIPNIHKKIMEALAHRFGTSTATEYDRWVRHTFVHSAADFEPFSNWYMVLALSRNIPDRWGALGLPKSISSKARLELDGILDRTPMHHLADEIGMKPLSPWDLEIYTLHGFDDDERNPYHWILETVKKRRFVGYLGRVAEQLSEDERRSFWDNADEVRRSIETTSHSSALEDPLLLVQRYANPN